MRRTVALVAAALLTACAQLPPAQVSPTPSPPRDVEVVVHSEPGGGVDLDARQWVRLLGEEGLIQGTWRVENRSGGAGLRAMAHLASQSGRDDVIAVMSMTWHVTPITTREATVTYRDLTPIAMLFVEPTVAVVRAASPYRTFADLIAAARERPGRLTQVGGQVSSAHNVYRELIQEATGARWSFVPLATRGERVSAVLGGHADLLMTEPADVLELQRAGEVRVLASIGPDRVAAFPDAPSLRDLGIAVELPPQRRGLVGPPGMRPEAVRSYVELFQRLTSSRRWADHVTRGSLQPAFLAGDDLRAALDREDAQLREALRRIGLAVR